MKNLLLATVFMFAASAMAQGAVDAKTEQAQPAATHEMKKEMKKPAKKAHKVKKAVKKAKAKKAKKETKAE